MASAAAVTPLGLLHMRPFQHWLHSRVPHYPGSPRVLPLPAVLLSEHRAGGQQTAQSRALAAGRLVSRSGVRLTTAPCLSAFLPRGAWGADEVADGPFHGQKPLVGLLHPHYPRRRSGQGVRGHSPGGESDRGAPVPTKRRHLEEPSTSPRPRPVGWQPLSRPKLIALRARQPLPCTPWLSCRFTKPRCSNRCTRVVPTRGWCRSCARRLTSLYERRKSQRGPSRRQCPPWWSRSAISGSTWQRWKTSTRHAFSTPPSPRQGCSATPSRALPSSSRQYSSRPRRSSTPAPAWCTIHRCPRGQASVRPSPWAPSCILQSCSPQAESIPWPARRASRRRVAPPASQSGPKSSRKSTKSVVPLEPLAQRLEAWLTLPSLSRWLTHTIQLGYAIQFAKRPPKFNGVLETPVAVWNAPVLREEIAVLLAKDAIEPVPPAKRRQGFYSPYFIVPKKRDDLRPILDLRVMNRALHKLPQDADTQAHYQMHPAPGLVCSDRPEGCLLHVSILLRHRLFRRFAFEGRA